MVAALDLFAVAGDVGLDAAGVHAGDLDRPVAEHHLLTQRLGEPAHGELRGVVGALRRHREQSEDARDVDDVTVAGLDEMRQERLGAVDDAPEVDVHDPVEVLERHLLDGAGEGDAGVVEDEIDRAEVGDDLIGVRQDQLALRDIEVIGLDLGTGLLDQRLRLGETVRVHITDREPCSAAGELDGQRAADAGSGAGHDGDLVGEVGHGGLSVPDTGGIWNEAIR